jgi:hypothetical protein
MDTSSQSDFQGAIIPEHGPSPPSNDFAAPMARLGGLAAEYRRPVWVELGGSADEQRRSASARLGRQKLPGRFRPVHAIERDPKGIAFTPLATLERTSTRDAFHRRFPD